MKIGFVNEMADLCERADADVEGVSYGIGLDRRIGAQFLQPGPGFGGSCFPKDIQALIKSAQDYGVPSRIIETVAAANEQRKRLMARRLIKACGGSVRGLTIAVLGLTFKANTDDTREAPATSIITALQDEGAEVRAYDPQGMDQARALMPDIAYATDPYSCVAGAHAVAIVTEWSVFRTLDLARLRARMAGSVLVDYRNIIPVGGGDGGRVPPCGNRPAQRHGGAPGATDRPDAAAGRGAAGARPSPLGNPPKAPTERKPPRDCGAAFVCRFYLGGTWGSLYRCKTTDLPALSPYPGARFAQAKGLEGALQFAERGLEPSFEAASRRLRAR